MAFPERGRVEVPVRAIVAAALAYLVSEQGHAVGLMTMGGGRLAYVPARGGRVHLRALWRGSIGWSPAAGLGRAAGDRARRATAQRRGVDHRSSPTSTTPKTRRGASCAAWRSAGTTSRCCSSSRPHERRPPLPRRRSKSRIWNRASGVWSTAAAIARRVQRRGRRRFSSVAAARRCATASTTR